MHHEHNTLRNQQHKSATVDIHSPLTGIQAMFLAWLEIVLKEF